MAATEDRAKETDFSNPYAKIGLALLVQKDSPITDATSLNQPGITIAIKLGTTGETYARQHLNKATILSLTQAGACTTEVSQGKADAFIYDQSSILEFAEKFPDTTKPLPNSIQTEFWAIGIQKGNTELLNEVNAFIKSFKESGGFEQLAETHLKTQKQRFEKAGVPFIF